MLDIGWPELLVVAQLCLIIVVGPKDLPPMLRAFRADHEEAPRHGQ